MTEVGEVATDDVLPSAAEINANAHRIVEAIATDVGLCIGGWMGMPLGNGRACAERHGSFQAEPPLRAWASTEAAGLS